MVSPGHSGLGSKLDFPDAAPNDEEADGTEIKIMLGPFSIGYAKSREDAKHAVDGLNNLLATLPEAQPIVDLATMYGDLQRRLLGFWDDLDPLNVDHRARTGRCGMCG